MNKLHFVLSDDEKTVLEFDASYITENDFYCFENDGISYKVRFDSLEFRRCFDGDEFILRGDKKASVVLNDINRIFDIKVNYFEYSFEEKKYTIKYILESDEGKCKTINIIFDN